MHLAEIRSIAVAPESKGQGAGRKLVEALLHEAERHHATCVCLFTRIPDFFAHMGFTIARREELPDKIYKDCVHCPNLTCCDEIAMVRGPIPQNGHRDLNIAIPLVRLGK
jgi:amino-acid N-acetyltransferase